MPAELHTSEFYHRILYVLLNNCIPIEKFRKSTFCYLIIFIFPPTSRPYQNGCFYSLSFVKCLSTRMIKRDAFKRTKRLKLDLNSLVLLVWSLLHNFLFYLSIPSCLVDFLNILSAFIIFLFLIKS